jgi:hypothetical protein
MTKEQQKRLMLSKKIQSRRAQAKYEQQQIYENSSKHLDIIIKQHPNFTITQYNAMYWVERIRISQNVQSDLIQKAIALTKAGYAMYLQKRYK